VQALPFLLPFDRCERIGRTSGLGERHAKAAPWLPRKCAYVLSRDKLAAVVAATRRLPDALMRQYLDIAQVLTPATIAPVIPADPECIRRVSQKTVLGARAKPEAWFFAFAVQFIRCSMH